MITQKFTVLPQGLVESGDATYQINTETGEASYTANVKVGMLFLAKTFAMGGPFKIDPKALKSDQVKVGMKVKLGAFALEVVSLTPDKKAQANIQILSPDMTETGTAMIDCSGEYVQLIEAKVAGQVYGQNIAIQIDPTI